MNRTLDCSVQMKFSIALYSLREFVSLLVCSESQALVNIQSAHAPRHCTVALCLVICSCLYQREEHIFRKTQTKTVFKRLIHRQPRTV